MFYKEWESGRDLRHVVIIRGAEREQKCIRKMQRENVVGGPRPILPLSSGVSITL